MTTESKVHFQRFKPKALLHKPSAGLRDRVSKTQFALGSTEAACQSEICNLNLKFPNGALAEE